MVRSLRKIAYRLRRTDPSRLRARPEAFGGIVALDDPPATVFIDRAFMQELGYRDSPRWVPLDRSGAPPLSAPITAHFAVTRRCPMGCRTCYNASGATGPDELTTQEAKRALDVLAEMQVFTVAFGGGEPLARPDIFELAEHARQRNITPTLTTNGYYVNEQLAERCRVFSHLHVSLDGVGETYDAVRGTNGFPYAARAIELLLRAGNSVGVNVVVCRANYHDLEELARFLAERGVDDLIFLRLKPGGRARQWYPSMRLTPEQVRGLFPLIKHLTRRYRLRPHVDCAMMPFIYWHRPNRKVLERWSGEGCVGAGEIIEIDPAGRVRACSFSAAAACQVTDLPAEWHRAAPFRELRSWIERAPEPCRSCSYLDICRGGCRALAQALTGNPDAPDPECPFVAEASGTSTAAGIGDSHPLRGKRC